MFHTAKAAENAGFSGFLIHSISTSDKVLRYGKFNQIEYSEHPTVVQRGDERTINIYAAVPDVAQDKPVAHWNLTPTYVTI